ncbi:MAG: response regulator transcription factor [Ignavibacteriales bacterium]
MIHIIDDDQSVRDGFIMLLKSTGFECDSFEGAEQFLDIWKPADNDLIILDIHLTGMNGCTLLENLTKRGLHLPIIIVTAYDEQTTRNAAKNFGALAYLRKPVDSEELIDLVKFATSKNPC